MNKTKLLSIVFMLLVGVVGVSAVPIDNIRTYVDGTHVDDIGSVGTSPRFDFERGQPLSIKIVFDATADSDNVEVQASFSGYEYNHDADSRLYDTSGVFDIEENVTYTKRMTVVLPNDVDEDDYRLRILITDRFGDSRLIEYPFKLDVPRNDMRLEDVELNPRVVEAGRATLVLARVENSGERDQDGVKITAEIPELGIRTVDFLDEVEAGDEVTSEALYLGRIPSCTKAGVYMVEVTMTYDDSRRTDTKNVPLTVMEDEFCNLHTGDHAEHKPEATREKTVIAVGPSNQDVSAGSSAVFPVTLTNAGATTKTYTLSVEGTDGWATVELSPSNVLVLGEGETQAAYVSVTPGASASAGQRTFVVTVKHNDEVLQQLPATVNVMGASSVPAGSNGTVGWEKVKRGLEIGLVVLVVLLVILGLIIAFNKMKNDEEEEDAQVEAGQTYY